MPSGSPILEVRVQAKEGAIDDALWYAELLRQGNAVAAIWRDGVIWPVFAAACLLASTFLVAWTNITLMQISGPGSVPIDLGWGLRIPILSYGLFSVVVVLWCLGRTLVALPWFAARRAGTPALRFRPLTPRALFGMGALVWAIPLLYLFQFLFADIGRVAQLAVQENQSLLIRSHLGYSLPRTHLVFTAFQFDITSLGDRWSLLVQVSDVGVLLPILAGLLCWVGAVRLLRARRLDATASAEATPSGGRAGWLRSHNRTIILAAAIFAAIVLARPVLAYAFDQQARAALDAGSFDSALAFLDDAAVSNPSITALASFHQDRGAALWALGNVNAQDAQLYLAQQYRALNDLPDAWNTDYALRQRFPASSAVEQDLALTYEVLIEKNEGLDSTAIDDQSAARNPQIFVTPQNLTAALPWVDQLITLEPNNPYARYVRGRMLYRIHDYESAALDFQALLPVAGDNDLRSAAYTYLALCQGGLGDYAGERTLLLKAVELDHEYNNTTARENASGLH